MRGSLLQSLSDAHVHPESAHCSLRLEHQFTLRVAGIVFLWEPRQFPRSVVWFSGFIKWSRWSKLLC